MLLKKGDSNSNVTYLQYALHILCYNPGSIDGIFGNDTYNSVVSYQISNNLDADGIVGDLTWNSLKENIKKIQTQLKNKNFYTDDIDGIAGINTFNAVIAFQKSNNLDADGIVGPNTKKILFDSNNGEDTSVNNLPVLQKGSTGLAVIKLQNTLISKGYSCGSSGADGDFGQGTYNAVCAFQRDHGLEVDGIVGPNTWAALEINSLSTWTSSVTGEPGIEKFINVAKEELKKGFKEINSNNITPYGEWYGMNGEPWCAMFVSWCADQAGILNTIVPRYAYCPTGVNLYKEKNRYKLNSSDYNPKAGDVIMFQTNGTIDHTGIVIENSNNVITTIEGNASDTVLRRTYSKTNSRIHGYGVN